MKRAVCLALLSQTACAFVHIARPLTVRSIVAEPPSAQNYAAINSQLQGLPNLLLTADGTQMNPLLKFFFESLISNGIPAVFTVIVIAFAAKSFRGARKSADEAKKDRDAGFSPLALLYDDLYGDQIQDNKPQLPGFLSKPLNQPKLPKNTGVPDKQYLKLTHWNPRLDSYRYSVTAATSGKGQAAAEYRQRSRERVFRKLNLTPAQFKQLATIEEEYLKTTSKLQTELNVLRQSANLMAVAEGMKKLGMNVSDPYALDPDNTEFNATMVANLTASAIPNEQLILGAVSKAESALLKAESYLIQCLTVIVGAEQAALVRAAIFGNLGIGERPLTKYLTSDEDSKRVFVANFPGDVQASQVENLRQEVTGILLTAKPGDEALVVLQSGGGTVTGYGLAAAQLDRLKRAGIHLTIAVEQVAASGGYMMACLADRIVASPFAVLGSIGVISEIPNVYERLKTEGIEFQTVTAGKFKRTLTPTKKVSKEDLQKSKEDLEQVYVLFRDFVAKNRPQLNIDAVATGETWFGSDALERKLCDELKTVDEILMEKVNSGYDVYEVAYKPPIESPFGKLLPAAEAAELPSVGTGGLLDSAVRWVIRQVRASVDRELSLDKSLEQRYLAKDDTAERFKSQS